MGNDTRSVQQIIDEMVQRIVEGFDPHRIILFGSHARGLAGPDSDVDLLVVMPVKGSRRQQTVAIRAVLHGMGLAKDVIVATPEEVEQYGDMVGTLIRPALREGKVLYERHGTTRRRSEAGPTTQRL
jgi:predicted nucleotidyltransferase